MRNKNKVIDAYGKPTSGILEGSFYWLGEFGVCKNATSDDWQGKYCLVNRPDAILVIIHLLYRLFTIFNVIFIKANKARNMCTKRMR